MTTGAATTGRSGQQGAMKCLGEIQAGGLNSGDCRVVNQETNKFKLIRCPCGLTVRAATKYLDEIHEWVCPICDRNTWDALLPDDAKDRGWIGWSDTGLRAVWYITEGLLMEVMRVSDEDRKRIEQELED